MRTTISKALLGILVGSATSGCQVMAPGQGDGGGGGATAGVTEVRIANAAPQLAAFDVCADDDLAIPNIRFGQVTGYAEIRAGTVDLRGVDAGAACDDDQIVGGTFTITRLRDYTFVMLPDQSEPIQLEDDNSPTDPGRARVRLINASPGSLALDVQDQGGITLFDDVRYNEPDDYDYIAVAAGTYDLIALPLAGDAVTLEIGIVTLEEGHVYTFFASGTVEAGDDEEPFNVVLFQDAVAGISG